MADPSFPCGNKLIATHVQIAGGYLIPILRRSTLHVGQQITIHEEDVYAKYSWQLYDKFVFHSMSFMRSIHLDYWICYAGLHQQQPPSTSSMVVYKPPASSRVWCSSPLLLQGYGAGVRDD